MLTDKAKEDFEIWLLKERNQTIVDTDREYDLYYLYKYMLPNDLKQVLIIEWFDSVESLSFQEILLESYKDNYLMYPLNSIFKEAIKKANENYNKL